MKKKYLEYLPISIGAVMIGLGLLATFFPNFVANGIAAFIGVILIGMGIQQIVFGMRNKDYVIVPGLKITLGCISLIVGLLFLLRSDISVSFIIVCFGIFATITGAVKLNVANQKRTLNMPCLYEFIDGSINLIFGIFMMFNPFSGLYVVVVVSGLFFVFCGANMIFSYFYLKKNSDIF